ncbi:TlyA family RNA methyltransferase [Acetivibrio saccincola]|uniref:16S/23S rRNA (Cytidine-2'-O)-methyltransferase TlyA n=1 Tax=Acetivibrio saccincola TaxID=1677857 RepID=A0A2K9E1K9_9FIRM|nr:TlyA family RNA methyltransferase [Acetivibrio saccincola]AUG57657.1 16S/23S rRNA (cytidine-2'-O)-methyltransferase TlyA [Acetivibrio saccincola]NLW26847.1 TlyA family RNA methyltransferase [Acetivibrio saccincola]PQQ67555.1 TlyA family rRNA (cytidine-2'-O)-methyltransferase [Acetivibrio saccincola]HOA97638.1 TlyA family RNA methyltransferase [Acetivibrio saccincola]HQD28438.1 TlyA family RNA methyltransferase [Acetivibrio saccincola]
MKKERLDVLLVQKGYFDSREKARSSIMAGVVFVDGEKVDKPGTKVGIDSKIFIKENVHPYVSRGGLKLEKAIKVFKIDLNEKVAIDIGASTGGFTDCMLKNGAKKVFAVDVGYGQLAWELRNDERVVCMERTNIRYVTRDQIGVLADFAAIDVSFISLKKVIPVAVDLLKEDGEILCLIKPQFEAGKDKVGKNGVVKDKDTHREVIEDILGFSIECGLKIKGLDFSPIKGPEGNIEFLAYLSKTEGTTSFDAKNIVEKSHEDLNLK